MPEKTKPSLLLTLGAASLLIGGGVATYWILTQRLGLLSNVPVGASIIPQNALLTLSVSTDSNQWQQLREFGTKQTQAELDKNLAELRDRFLTKNGYNYQRDIQPWVGDEITVAFLPPATATTKPTPNSPTAANQQSLVMVLPIENPVAAKQVLTSQPLQQGKWVEREYKGVQVRELQGKTAQRYSTAVLDQRFLVVTDDAKATERAIDTYKGGTSVAKTAGYTQSLNKIEDRERFAQLYVNVPVAATVAAANPSGAVAPQGLTQLQEHQGLATTITLEPEGVKFKSISWLKPNSQREHVVENKAGKMQRRLPAETLMMISGGDLQQLWQDYLQGAQSNPLTPIRPENLQAGVKSITGLDLEPDLLSWMGGEFAVAVIPAATKAGSTEEFALSLVFMVQTSNRSRAEKAFQQLDDVISRQHQFQVQEVNVKGKPIVNWISPFGTLTATHGWLDEDVAFLSLGAPVVDRVVPAPATALASSEQFQKTVPSELNPHNGQFFLDVAPTVKALPLPQFFSGQQMFLEATRSIGLTAAVIDQRSVRYDIFVSLKKVGAVPSSPGMPDSSPSP